MLIYCLNLINILLYNWLGMLFVLFGKYYKNLKKYYIVIVFGFIGLILLYLVNSVNFRKYFNRRDYFKSIFYGIWRYFLNEYFVCNN